MVNKLRGEESALKLESDEKIPTTEKIRLAFIECLKEKMKVNEITIDYLSKRAGVSKSTFYRNYKDIYDIYEQLVDEFLERVEDLIDKLLFEKSITTTELVFVLLKNGLKKDNKYFLARDVVLLDYSIGMGTSRIVELMYDKCYDCAIRLAKRMDIDDERADFGATFFLYGNIIPIIMTVHSEGKIELKTLMLTMEIFEEEVAKWKKNQQT